MGLLDKIKRKPGRPKKEDTVSEAKRWLEKVARAEKVKARWKEQFRCGLAYEFWEGRQRPAHIPADEWITVNLMFSTLQAELPTLYSNDPYFYVKLKKSYKPNPMDIVAYEGKARIRQAMLNYLKGELRLKSKARLAIFDAFFQFGVIKVHLDGDVEENPRAGESILDEAGFPMVGDDNQPLLEPETLAANEAYELTRVNPDDFIVDEDADPLGYNWCAQRIVRPLVDAKEDSAYGPARKRLKATQLSQELKDREIAKKGSGLAAAKPSEVDPDVVVIWEVYDQRKEEWFLIAEGMEDEYLVKPSEFPKGFDGAPYLDLRYTLRTDSWYPHPPTSPLIDSQQDYCEARSKIKVHRKRFNRKYVLYSQAFQDAEKAADKVTLGEDGTVVIADVNPGFEPVSPIRDAPVDQQVQMELMLLRQDFNDLAVGANQRGSTAGVDSATEAGILEQRARVREGDKLGMVADFIQDIARKLDQLVQAHITRDQAVKVSGPQGERWMEVRATDYEEIEGEYEYSVNVGASTPQLPEIERAQWTAFLGLLAGAPQLMLSKSLLTQQAKNHHIEDEAMIEELWTIGQKIMGGQLPMPGQQGSPPGGPDPATAVASASGGAAAGINNVRGGAA